VTVNKPGDPLHGLQITLRTNAFSAVMPLEVSYAPILSQTFGRMINPLTPLIQIENGGGYARQPIILKVPIQLPANHFALAFYYDPNTGRLEGMPLVQLRTNSLTLATCHFCEVVVSSVAIADLPEVVDTGFRPEFDDWEFVNRGSYIAPGGHCAGQSMSAIYDYYQNMDRVNAPTFLYNRYDNQMNPFRTPAVGDDNVLGYKLASVVQADYNAGWVSNPALKADLAMDLSDLETYRAFVYAMMASRSPQLVYISRLKGAHAMIVYQAERGRLRVADPNYPAKSERFIELSLATMKFDPYYSGPNADDLGYAYPEILYIGLTSVVDWEKIGQRWQEFFNQTIGIGLFPDYSVKVEDRFGGVLTTIWSDDLSARTVHTTGDSMDLEFSELPAKYDLVDPNGVAVGEELKPGTNVFGLRKYEWSRAKSWDWAGFHWFIVIRDDPCTNAFCGCDFPLDYAKLKPVKGGDSLFPERYFIDSEGMRQGGFISYWYGNTNKVKLRGCYLDDLRQGLWTSYYENGIVNEMAYYTAGVRTGHYESFHEKTGARWEWGRYADYDGSIEAHRFAVSGIADLTRLAKDLNKHGTAVSAYLWNRLSVATRDLIAAYVKDSTRRSRLSLETALVQELDAILEGPSIYDENRFSNVGLSETTRSLLQNPSSGDSVRLNRLLLEDACGRAILGRERKTGFWSRCDENGKLEYQWTYLPNGEVHVVTYYNERRTEEFTYVDDWNERIGLETKFYDNGQVSSEKRWSRPYTLDGVSRTWYPDGKPSSKGNYQNNVLEGEWITWYDNGQLWEKGSYVNGQKKGVWTTWNKDGTMAGQQNFP
jgi:antitoxin component YwqK of YwqJK toxin-antitoxin module